MEQGLTSDFAWAVCKDKYNYVWIGTQNGVNRYDGHRIKQYFHNTKDSFSAPGNSVYWIHKDKEGELWFSFGWQGVARYNYAKDRFERFAPFDSIKKAHNYMAPSWRVNSDRQGRIYFACGGAVFRYTKSTGKMEDLTPLFNGDIEGYGVGMFIPQGDDLLWIVSGNGLFRYDLKKEQVRHIAFDKEAFGFGEQEMHDAEFINDHEMLVSVVRTGFVLFDTRTETFRMPPPPINPSDTKAFSETGGVLRDSKGRIWLANSRYGLLEYFPANNTTYSLKNERLYPYPYAEQEGKGLNVYEDDEGNIWYCNSAKGVIWFKPETDFVQIFERDFASPETLPGNVVTGFLPVGKNKLMIGTGNGIAEFDASSNRFKNFPVALNLKDVYPHPAVRGLLQKGDLIYITTAYGLSVYNGRTGGFSRHLDSAPLFDSAFLFGQWLIADLPEGLLLSGSQLALFHPETKTYSYASALKANPLFSLTDVNAIYLDKTASTLWLEAGSGGLYAYNTQTKTVTQHHFTTDKIDMIDAFAKDEEGRLWIGSNNGLYRYDPQTGKGQKIALNASVKEIYNIAIGDNVYVWLTTPKEVIRYNRAKNTAEVLASTSFLPNSAILKRAFFLSTDGFIWVGTNKGFGKIDTKRFHTTTVNTQPQLVNFSVFDESRSFDRALPELDKIVLRYNENFFSFVLSS
ncbi:MAG TPA: two-component regulator propeller domain-containing protein, partial [Flavisolibacter sp.]|nr:two-component regulator propeller domain-containing protein [Flavisolibacter sp.]